MDIPGIEEKDKKTHKETKKPSERFKKVLP